MRTYNLASLLGKLQEYFATLVVVERNIVQFSQIIFLVPGSKIGWLPPKTV